MLHTLFGIHNEFCKKEYGSQKALEAVLKKSSRLEPFVGYTGVFELKVDDISFAVSAEDDGCTTDVLSNNPETGEVFCIDSRRCSDFDLS